MTTTDYITDVTAELSWGDNVAVRFAGDAFEVALERA